MNNISPIYLVFLIGVGGMVGFACGKIPYNAAMKRRREGLAMTGMVMSVIVGALGGCISALPFALLFAGFVVLLGEGSGASAAWDDPGYRGGDGRRPPRGRSDTPPPGRPYTEIGHLIVCGACQMATSKEKGAIPPACPHCRHQFAATIPRPKKRQVEEEEEGLVPLRRVAQPARRRE